VQLGAQAADERDPEKLIALVTEIPALLGEQERRLGILPILPSQPNSGSALIHVAGMGNP
jgi:hypothetical protein